MYKNQKPYRIDRIKDKPFWRYMEFWKFLDLIETSELYFPSIEDLGDQNEGKIPDKVFNYMVNSFDRVSKNNNPANSIKSLIENEYRKTTLISSWNAMDNESYPMWKMYAKEKLGIAIKTDFEGLRNCFHKSDVDIFISQVEYYDGDISTYQINNTIYHFLIKHHYYKAESEVRCITRVNDALSFSNRISVDLSYLIKEVFISPFAYSKGFHNIIEFLREKKNLNFKINISSINDTYI